jgi:hypothetical protein
MAGVATVWTRRGQQRVDTTMRHVRWVGSLVAAAALAWVLGLPTTARLVAVHGAPKAGCYRQGLRWAFPRHNTLDG